MPGVLKVHNGLLYAAYGEGGLVISDESSGEFLAQLFPPRNMNSIDDFDVEGNLIFAIDSRGQDYMCVFTFERNEGPDLVTPPVEVQGGPFNGISAKNGNLVVSGGTTFLKRFTYSKSGDIEGPITFGRDRGHPDVLLSDNGQYAFISTDFTGLVDQEPFGITSLFIGEALSIPTLVSELGLPGSGFTVGVTKPVGFPIQSAILEEHLLVAHGGGLAIIQLVDQGGFGNNFTLDIGINGIAVAAEQATIYVIGYQNENPMLVSIDVSDIQNPVILDTHLLMTNQIPTSIAIGATDLYIAVGQDGIIQLPK